MLKGVYLSSLFLMLKRVFLMLKRDIFMLQNTFLNNMIRNFRILTIEYWIINTFNLNKI
jgi:hypothetical protein